MIYVFDVHLMFMISMYCAWYAPGHTQSWILIDIAHTSSFILHEALFWQSCARSSMGRCDPRKPTSGRCVQLPPDVFHPCTQWGPQHFPTCGFSTAWISAKVKSALLRHFSSSWSRWPDDFQDRLVVIIDSLIYIYIQDSMYSHDHTSYVNPGTTNTTTCTPATRSGSSKV